MVVSSLVVVVVAILFVIAFTVNNVDSAMLIQYCVQVTDAATAAATATSFALSGSCYFFFFLRGRLAENDNKKKKNKNRTSSDAWVHQLLLSTVRS